MSTNEINEITSERYIYVDHEIVRQLLDGQGLSEIRLLEAPLFHGPAGGKVPWAAADVPNKHELRFWEAIAREALDSGRLADYNAAVRHHTHGNGSDFGYQGDTLIFPGVLWTGYPSDLEEGVAAVTTDEEGRNTISVPVPVPQEVALTPEQEAERAAMIETDEYEGGPVGL